MYQKHDEVSVGRESCIEAGVRLGFCTTFALGEDNIASFDDLLAFVVPYTKGMCARYIAKENAFIIPRG